METKCTLVFQYGSNASYDRINSPKRLDGAAKQFGLAHTRDCFDLSFTHFSRCNQCATVDLVPNGSRQIYGVLYQIPDDRIYRSCSVVDWRTLDEIEGEGSAYFRTRIPVVMADDLYEPITYLVKTPSSGIKTSTKYVGHIIKGLREHDAPEDYITYVKKRAIENNSCLASELAEM
jgi:hypothetical protein